MNGVLCLFTFPSWFYFLPRLAPGACNASSNILSSPFVLQVGVNHGFSLAVLAFRFHATVVVSASQELIGLRRAFESICDADFNVHLKSPSLLQAYES